MPINHRTLHSSHRPVHGMSVVVNRVRNTREREAKSSSACGADRRVRLAINNEVAVKSTKLKRDQWNTVENTVKSSARRIEKRSLDVHGIEKVDRGAHELIVFPRFSSVMNTDRIHFGNQIFVIQLQPCNRL